MKHYYLQTISQSYEKLLSLNTILQDEKQKKEFLEETEGKFPNLLEFKDDFPAWVWTCWFGGS
jgi:hypothetical protein